MADYAIHDTTLIGTSNIIRKKEGSSALIDPADYPKRINLMGMLEKKTIVQSPICNFADGADDVPTDSVKIFIPANLDGKSSVSEVQTGKTVFYPMDIEQGSINSSGNNVNSTTRLRTIDRKAVTPSTEYKIKVNSEVQIYEVHEYTDLEGSSTHLTVNASEYTFTTQSTTNYLRILFRYSNNATILPSAITSLQVTDDWKTYTAQLGRTVYGGTADIVNGVCGPINLLNTDEFVQRSGYNNLSVSVSNNMLTLSGYDAGGRFGCFNIQTDVGKDYTVKYTDRSNVQNVRVVESDTKPTNWINGGSAVGVNSAYTYTATKPWVQIWVEMTADNATVTDLQVELGSTASAYSPFFDPFTFDGQEVPTRLGYNAFWSEQGDTSVAYRASGTIYQYPKGEEASF